MNAPVDMRKVLRAAMREDFLAFAERAFQHLEPGKDWLIARHMLAIAYQLERVISGEIRRLIISMPPRMLKSHLASVAFPAFLMMQNPAIRIVTASHTAELAETFSMRTRSILQSDWYRELAPRVRLSRSTQSQIETTCGGSRLAIGVDGALLGRGGDVIIIDDAMSSDGGVSEADRRRVWDWYTGVVGSRLDNPKEGAIIVVAQRLHIDDLTGRLLQQKGWHHLVLPAIAWADAEIPLSDDSIWRRKAGDLLMPERLGPAELKEIEALQGHRFEAQYQQRPSPPSGYLFKAAKFRRYSMKRLPPSQIEGTFVVVDSAISTAETANYTAVTVWGIREAGVYLRQAVRARWSIRKQLDVLKSLHDHYRSNGIIIEKHASGPELFQQLRAERYPVQAFSQRDDKIARAEMAELKVHRGLVHVDPGMPNFNAFMSELTAFPHGKNDDYVDSMTLFLKFLEYPLSPYGRFSYYGDALRDRPRPRVDDNDPWLID